MVIVQRANKQLRVAESHLQHYLDKGYVEIKTVSDENAPKENTPKGKKEKQEEKPKKAKK